MKTTRSAPLTADEELSLARAARAGDAAAVDRLLSRHMGFIVSFARTRHRGEPPLDDLIQEGVVGFLQGLARFDCDREPPVRVLTFTRRWIERNVRRAGWREDHRYGGIRLPEATYHEIGRSYRGGTEPTIAIDALRRRRRMPLGKDASSDRPGEKGGEPADVTTPSPLDRVIRAEEIRRVRRALERLPEPLRRSLAECYGEGGTADRAGRRRPGKDVHALAIARFRDLLRPPSGRGV